MLKVGDKIVFPPHGVGIVEGVEERQVDGKTYRFFKVRLIGENMSILIPEVSVDSSGIRHVLSEEEIGEIFNYLSRVPEDVSEKWTVRHRLNIDRIRTGELKDLATVVRNLSFLSRTKELSYSEKRMFEEAFSKLCEEIALSLGEDVKKIKQRVRKILSSAGEK